MARQSADARAAATLKAGGKYPPPPDRLSNEAKVVWARVIVSRPIDYFDAGTLVLFERYCIEVVNATRLEDEIEVAHKIKPRTVKDRYYKAAMMRGLQKQLMAMNQSLRMSATKLRLTVQASVDWHNRKNTERGQPPAKKTSALLGGEAVHGEEHSLNS